jgi:hypothetical protein
MKNEKKQTAVEWLAKSYMDLLIKLNNEEVSLKEFEIQYIELLDQAKEMEKQQIINAVNANTNQADFDCIEPILYYNETYGGNK